MAEIELGVNVGKFNTDGSVAEDVIYCAFTGRFVRGVHSVRERVLNSPYFYRVDANDLHLVTDEWRAEFVAQVKTALGEPESKPLARDLRRPEKVDPKAEA